MISDVILENKALMDAFLTRFKEYKISCHQLVKEMNEDGITMDVKRLQRFIHHGMDRRITQKAYLWLLLRHGIEISLHALGPDSTDEKNRLKAKEFAK